MNELYLHGSENFKEDNVIFWFPSSRSDVLVIFYGEIVSVFTLMIMVFIEGDEPEKYHFDIASIK